MNLASSSKWFTKRKSSLTSNLPKSMSIREISKYYFSEPLATITALSKRNLISSLQKVPKGDSMILNLYSFAFVKIMRFNNLY